MASRDDFERANQRGKDLQARIPRAVAARYDRKGGRVVIELSSKVSLSFSAADVEGLENAQPSELAKIELSPSGFGIHFPAIDADIFLPGLLEGVLGSKTWMASRLGQAGGRSRSVAKKRASQANGKLGGRPRKQAASKASEKLDGRSRGIRKVAGALTRQRRSIRGMGSRRRGARRKRVTE
jgi:hypothetical protein